MDGKRLRAGRGEAGGTSLNFIFMSSEQCCVLPLWHLEMIYWNYKTYFSFKFQLWLWLLFRIMQDKNHIWGLKKKMKREWETWYLSSLNGFFSFCSKILWGFPSIFSLLCLLAKFSFVFPFYSNYLFFSSSEYYFLFPHSCFIFLANTLLCHYRKQFKRKNHMFVLCQCVCVFDL